MKEVCHRKATTSCEAFVRKKLTPRHIDTAAIPYGKDPQQSSHMWTTKTNMAKQSKLINVVYQCIHLHPGLLKVLMELSLMLLRNVIIEAV